MRLGDIKKTGTSMTQSHDNDAILIYGANEHNLKNIDVRIPRGLITSITGVSGAGKSSLAFDTLLSESYRKFFFTLSHYYRQFLPTKNKARVRKIIGLSPAIGLSQYETRPSPYASVASLTDLAELIGVLFAQYSETFCPKHGLATEALSFSQIAQQIQTEFKAEVICICAPLVQSKKGTFHKQLEKVSEKGFLKIYCDGNLLSLSPIPQLDADKKHTIKVVVDYITVAENSQKRVEQSISTACELAEGYVEIFLSNKKGELKTEGSRIFSTKSGCPTCGFSWPKLDSRYFGANSLGRCSSCSGLGALESLSNQVSGGSVCGTCQGTGISCEYLSIHVGGINIHEVYLKTVSETLKFMNTLRVTNEAKKLLLEEIKKALIGLERMGLGYLNLFRKITSLSLGEHQRTRLASVLSQDLSGILYVLDEPSQGLHASELESLYQVLLEIKEKGNTLVLVDHDPYLLKKSDWIIDLGPTGGRFGGYKQAEFEPKEAKLYEDKSLTAKSLVEKALGQKFSNFSQVKVNPEKKSEFIRILGASCHNLKIEEVSFKKNSLNIVTGVSGAGKTSLVIHTLYRNLAGQISKEIKNKKGLFHCHSLEGVEDFEACYLINRMPLAKTSASLVVTYLGVFTWIRDIFASGAEAKMIGLESQDFSLRTGEGRCSECQGRGYNILEMRFLEDAEIVCPLCQGKRYKLNVLSVRYKGKTIADILDLSVDEAKEFFHSHQKIRIVFEACQKIGLGYLKLGQASTHFSGGEAQRLKIVSTFLKAKKENKLLILDEPTRGLHEQDIKYLVTFLTDLTESNATVIVVEHHTGLICAAQWVVDLGPGSAHEGGNLLYQGSPEGLLKNKATSVTARFL